VTTSAPITHFRGLAANEGAAVVLAGFRDAGHNLFSDFGIEPPGGEVVHEEEWRGALYGDVIDAMIDQASAHRVMQVHLEGDPQLGAHTINARDQHRVLVLLLVEREHPAEAADIAEYALGISLMGEVLDPLLGAVGAFDVHTGVGVGYDAIGVRLVRQVGLPSE